MSDISKNGKKLIDFVCEKFEKMSNIVDHIHDMIEEYGSEEAYIDSLRKFKASTQHVMKNYTVYFELYGKKMKTTVGANSEDKAKQIIKDNIIFHKVESKQDDIFDFLKGFEK